MSSSSRRDLRPVQPAETAPKPSRSGQILLNLRSAAVKMSARYPEALKLEAEIVAAVAEETKGDGDIFRGPRGEEVWGDVLEGKRRAHVGDLARVFKSRRPKGRQAAQRIAALLAAEIGMALVSLDAVPTEEPGKALGRMAREFGDVVHAVSSAGQTYEAEELEAIEKELREFEDAYACLRTSIRHLRNVR